MQPRIPLPTSKIGTAATPAFVNHGGIVQTNAKPDVGNAQRGKPDQVPQEIGRDDLLWSLIERLKDEQRVNIEKQGGERETDHTYPCNPTVPVAIEPDGERQPEKRDQIKNGKRHGHCLENMLRRQKGLHDSHSSW